MTKYYLVSKLNDIFKHHGVSYDVIKRHKLTSLRTEIIFQMSNHELETWCDAYGEQEISEEDVSIQFLGLMDEDSVLDEYEKYAKYISTLVDKDDWKAAVREARHTASYEGKMPEDLNKKIWRKYWTIDHRDKLYAYSESRGFRLERKDENA